MVLFLSIYHSQTHAQYLVVLDVIRHCALVSKLGLLCSYHRLHCLSTGEVIFDTFLGDMRLILLHRGDRNPFCCQSQLRVQGQQRHPTSSPRIRLWAPSSGHTQYIGVNQVWLKNFLTYLSESQLGMPSSICCQRDRGKLYPGRPTQHPSLPSKREQAQI